MIGSVMQQIEYSALSAVEQTLVHAAMEVRQKAYVPFSHYKCGAALLDVANNIHAGCNVETLDMTLTTHAEMDALNGMIKSGVFKLQMMVCALQAQNGFALPCGLCRQKIREFSIGDDARLLGVNLDENGQIRHIVATTIGELYPYPFTPDCLD